MIRLSSISGSICSTTSGAGGGGGGMLLTYVFGLLQDENMNRNPKQKSTEKKAAERFIKGDLQSKITFMNLK
jgi:hypothetical protein